MSEKNLPRGWRTDLIRAGDKEAVFYPVGCEIPAYSIRVDIDDAGDERDSVLTDLSNRLGVRIEETTDEKGDMMLYYIQGTRTYIDSRVSHHIDMQTCDPEVAMQELAAKNYFQGITGKKAGS